MMATVMGQDQVREQSPSSENYLDDDFEQWLQSLMDEFHVPGMSVAVVNAGKVEAKGYGFASLPDVPATADTIFGMASTNKAITAALLGLLIHESQKKGSTDNSDGQTQQLSWSTPLQSILKDDLATRDPYITSHMTIEDALSHRSGIPGHDWLWGPWLKTPTAMTQLLRDLEINEPFRTKCQYNNLMYGVVGDVIERITDQSYSLTAKKRILEPLKMDNTFLSVEEASPVLAAETSSRLHFARGYYWVPEDKSAKPEDAKKGYYVADPHSSIQSIDPAGGILSSVADYTKWVQVLLQSAQDVKKDKNTDEDASTSESTQQLISNGLWNELTTPRTFWLPPSYNKELVPERPNGQVNPRTYALGWFNDPYAFPGETVVQHGGGIPSFGSLVYLLPNRNFGIVTAANTAGSSNDLADFVTKELIGRRLNMSKEERRRRFPKEEKTSPHYNASDPEFVSKTLKLTSHPADSSDPEPGPEGTSTFYLDDKPVFLPQTFTNPAYGTSSVSLASDTLAMSLLNRSDNGIPVIKANSTIPSPDQSNGTTTSQGSHTIKIRLHGARGLNAQFILHPSAIKDDKIIYDLEVTGRHGPPNPKNGDYPDPFASLPPGHGTENDPRYPYKDMQVWESQQVQINGAVLVLSGNDRARGGGHSSSVERLGLKLARVEEVKGIQNGVLEEGWERTLEWFTRASPGPGT